MRNGFMASKITTVLESVTEWKEKYNKLKELAVGSMKINYIQVALIFNSSIWLISHFYLRQISN